MDGDEYSNTGGCVRAGYRFDGNVTSHLNVSMGAYGAVRYEYVYSVPGGGSMILHMWTEDMLCASSLKIIA